MTKPQNLQNQYEKQKKKSTIFLVIGLIGFAGIFITIISAKLNFGALIGTTDFEGMQNVILGNIKRMALAQVFFIIFFIGMMGYALTYKKLNIYKAGVQGEVTASNILAGLPSDYKVFHDKNIQFDGKNSQLDFIVTGPTGIFVVETKNVSGTIIGSAEDKQLIATKVTQSNNKYQKPFYNPIKQVGTHVYRIANHLSQKGMKYYVQGVVLFTHATSDVQISAINQTPVFSVATDGSSAVVNFIVNYQPKKNLNKDDLHKINNYLSTLI